MESVAPDRVPPRAAYHVHVRASSIHNGVHNEIFIDASAPLRVEEHRYVCLTPCIYVHVYIRNAIWKSFESGIQLR